MYNQTSLLLMSCVFQIKVSMADYVPLRRVLLQLSACFNAWLEANCSSQPL